MSSGVINILMQATGISQVEKAFSDATSAVSGFAASAAKIAANAATSFSMIGFAAAGLKTVWEGLTGPLKLAADAEKTAVSFNVLLGSAEKADSVLKGIRDFANTTPFEFPELAQAGKKLLAFGVDASQVVPIMRQLGDISAGLDVPIGELAQTFGKVKTAGKLTGETLQQFQEKGIPLQAELAKLYGMTAEQITKLVEQGRVKFSSLEKVITNLTGVSSKFGGLTAKQAETLGGLWSTAQDGITGALTKIGTKIVETFNLKGVLKYVISFIDSATPVLESALNWFSNLLAAWQPAFSAIGSAISSVVSVISSVFGPIIAIDMQMLSALGSAVAATWNYIVDVVTGKTNIVEDAMRTVGVGFIYVEDILDDFAGVIEDLVAYFGDFGGIVESYIVPTIDLIGETFGILSDDIYSTQEPVLKWLAETYNWLSEQITNAVNVVSYVWSNFGKSIDLAMYSASYSIVRWANQVIYFFTDVIPGVLVWFGNNWQDIFHDIGEFAVTTFSNLTMNIVEIFKNLPGLISGSVKFEDLWKPLLDGAKFTLKELPKIADRIPGAYESELKKSMEAKADAIGEDFASFTEKNKLTVPVQAKVEGLNKVVDKLAKPDKQLKDKPGAGTKEKKEKNFADLAILGSSEAHKILIGALGLDKKDKTGEKIEKNGAAQVNLMQKQILINQQIRDNIKKPDVVVKF